MALTQITIDDVKRLHAEVNAAMETIAAAHGLSYTPKGGSFSSVSFATRVEFAVRVTKDGESVEKKRFEMFAIAFGLEARDYGAEFTNKGRRYRLVGIDPKRRQYPYRCERDGKQYNFPRGASALIIAARKDEKGGA